MKTKAFTKEERETMIVTWFALRIQKGNEEYATMNAIARGLGLSPSTHLANILKGMCKAKILHSIPYEKSGRWTGSQYMLYPGSYQPPQRRSISLKVSGKPHGQLELF